MKKCEDGWNSIIIYDNFNNPDLLIKFLDYMYQNKFIVYLYGSCYLKDISDLYLNAFYIKQLDDIEKHTEYCSLLLRLDKKLESLFLFQQYELLDITKYALYEVCLVLEEAYKKGLNVNKIKEKILKYLESKNKLEIFKQVQKIKIYG